MASALHLAIVAILVEKAMSADHQQPLNNETVISLAVQPSLADCSSLLAAAVAAAAQLDYNCALTLSHSNTVSHRFQVSLAADSYYVVVYQRRHLRTCHYYCSDDLLGTSYRDGHPRDGAALAVADGVELVVADEDEDEEGDDEMVMRYCIGLLLDDARTTMGSASNVDDGDMLNNYLFASHVSSVNEKKN